MSTAVNDWWSDDPAERFWLVNERWGEVTDEGVIIAPKSDKRGNPSTYSRLCRLTNVGDILFHYWTEESAIVWWSEITSKWWSDKLHTQYVGYPTRNLYVPAIGFDYRRVQELNDPISLGQLRRVEFEIRVLNSDMIARYGTSIYFPWSVSDKRPLRSAQRYLSKLPASAVSILERLGNFEIPSPDAKQSTDVLDEGAPREEPPVDEKRVIVHTSTADSAGRISDAELRKAIEQHAVELARQFFTNRDYDVVSRESEMPYDLEATPQAGSGAETLHVEVKGSSTPIDHVNLTSGEVDHDPGGVERVLFVVDDIAWAATPGGHVETTGGRERVWWPWYVNSSSKRLTPLSYRYSLPPMAGR